MHTYITIEKGKYFNSCGCLLTVWNFKYVDSSKIVKREHNLTHKTRYILNG